MGRRSGWPSIRRPGSSQAPVRDRTKWWAKPLTPRSSKSRKTMTQKHFCAMDTWPMSWSSAAATALSRAPRQSRSRQAFHLRGCSRRTFKPFRQTRIAPPSTRQWTLSRPAALPRVDVITLNEEDTPQHREHRCVPDSCALRRERLERKIGKPLAGLYAMVQNPAPRQARANPPSDNKAVLQDFTVFSATACHRRRDLRLPAE